MKTLHLFIFLLFFPFLLSCSDAGEKPEPGEREHPGLPEVPEAPEEEHTYPVNPVDEIAYAFPGAEGGGRYATGGRGGKVYVITSLEDDGSPGTLRHALLQSGRRIVVFNVSGTIFLNSSLSIREGDLTIAGQTAPGDGICVASYPVVVNASNVIIRYMRFRMGDREGEKVGADGADGLEGRKQERMIIDHCSISWSTDECASFYDNKDFTMQWCLISESLRLSGHSKGPHGYGGIWGGVNASFHHNLMAHHDSRTPRYGPGAKYVGTETTDVRNNVFYNWSGNGCYGGEGMSVNIVNNYYKPGPATDSDRLRSLVMAIDIKREETGDFASINDVPGSYYLSGNYFPNDPEVSANNWKGVRDNTGWGEAALKAQAPCTTEPLTVEHTAQIAYERVLSYAGCSRSRDDIDRRIIQETATGTATYKGLSEHNGKEGDWKSASHPKMGIIDSQDDLKPAAAGSDWSPWPVLKSEEPLLDTDGDGMPDAWEIANGLDPYTPDANGRHLSTGYDNIEVYINSLVEYITRLQYQ